MACRSDAESFCAELIGKPPQMNACLRDNKAKLSDVLPQGRGSPRRLNFSVRFSHPFLSAKPTRRILRGQIRRHAPTKALERTFALRAFASMSA